MSATVNNQQPPPVDPAYYGLPYGMMPPDMGSGGDGFSPAKLLRCFLSKWWLIGLCVAVGLSGGAFYLSVVTPQYKASSLIEMSVRRPRLTEQRTLVSSDSDHGSARSEEVFNTRIEKFKGSRMQQMVAERLRAAGIAPALDAQQIAELLDSITLEMLRGTYLMRITSLHPDPQVARLGANLYAEAAVDLTMEENRTTSDNAVAWLIQQADQQRKNLRVMEERLTAFRESQQIDAMENERDAVHASLQQIGTELTRILNLQVLAAELMDVLTDVEVSPRSVGELPLSTPGRDSIMEAVRAWQDTDQEQQARLSRYTAEHPAVIAAQAQIDQHKAHVDDMIRRAYRTADADATLLRRQADALQARMDAVSRKASELESRIVRLRSERDAIENERNIADIAYKGLLSRIEEARIAADENTTTVKVAEEAGLPREPYRPRPLMVLFLGLVLGGAAGCGLVLLLHLLEDRFDDSEELARILGCDVLGLVPKFDDKARSVAGRQVQLDRFGMGAEAYARVRTRLQGLLKDNERASFMVCSAQPSEGKTVTAANLALSFARTGVRTLLVDFDMRRPQVKSVFALDDGVPCLLDILGKGGETIDFGVLPVKTDCPGLDVIANHAAREYSAAEVIGGKATHRFMTWAHDQYDLVLVDAPPFGGVSDALTLGGLVDGTVLVHRPGVSRRRTLRHAVNDFTGSGNTVLGVVINGVNFKRSPIFSNYNYHYGSSYYKYHTEVAKHK